MGSSIPSKKYHVFISFRGEDTRDNFTSHLYDALCRNNIETYIDYKLEKGEKVWPSLEKAIHDSMMFLIVFSENYATSTWCLKELTTILECSKEEGLRVIPVFYKVDPSHIRKQKGSYESALRNHEKGNPKQLVQKWRDALTYAANLSGWDSSNYRNEAEFTQQIVTCVLKTLAPGYQDVCLEGLVGVKEKVEDVELLMQNSSPDVRFIGIWGMAGSGKTTISKALFNKFCFSFDSFCFLANVREEYERFGIEHIKHQLLSSLLEDEKYYKGMPDGGSTYVGMRLSQKKVLVVLDDINNSKQLENLAGAHHWFGAGSRIIITTRDKKLLGKNVVETYEVELLTSDEALELFKMNAFKDNNCCDDEEFECLSMKAINYANGLPLALIVLGRFLYGEDKIFWKSQLEKLRKMPPKDIQSILILSYNNLDHEEKEVFLFVACYFKTCKVEHIKSLLDACGLSTSVGLRSLQDKALLTISYREVSMHDLIKEMGKQIVREESWDDPGKRSRLWDAKDICRILKEDMGSKAIKSITLDMSKAEDLSLSPQAFSKMPNLLFLDIYNSSSSKKHKHHVHLPQGLGYLPNELRYLCWDNYPLESLPPIFSAVNLVELDMRNNGMRELWHGVLDMVNLKKINLRHCKQLKILPDLSKAKSLETVSLIGCARIGELHPSILSENKLRELRLINCVALKSLKSDTESRSLCEISLVGCSNLKEFSIIAENLRNLDIRRTAIKEVPSCIGRMPKLQCASLLSLPPQLPPLSLEQLHVSDCASLQFLPPQLPPPLKHLHVSDCASLLTLPPQLPPSLEKLHVSNCASLLFLPQLPPSLEQLQVYFCSSLLSLPPQLSPSLKSLHVSYCESLQFLPKQLPPPLKQLYVSGCASLLTLPPQLPSSLEILHVSCCASLRSLSPWLPPFLKSLSVDCCPHLRSLPHLPQTLEALSAQDCPHLRSVAHVTQSHQSLFVSNSSSQETVHDTLTIGKLCQATFQNCYQLDEHSVRAILANAILQHGRFFELRCPGSRVPKWFKYRTPHPSIVVDLSSAPLSLDWTILFCIVVPPLPSWTELVVRYRCQIPILAKWEAHHIFYSGRMESSHANIWLDENICRKTYQIKECRATSNSKILLQLEIKCFQMLDDQTEHPIEINEYGVCPTYSWECQKFLNEMGLSQASTSQVPVLCPYGKQDCKFCFPTRKKQKRL